MWARLSLSTVQYAGRGCSSRDQDIQYDRCAHSLSARGSAPGAAGRLAIAIAGDGAQAKVTVADFIDEIGFDIRGCRPLVRVIALSAWHTGVLSQL